MFRRSCVQAKRHIVRTPDKVVAGDFLTSDNRTIKQVLNGFVRFEYGRKMRAHESALGQIQFEHGLIVRLGNKPLSIQQQDRERNNTKGKCIRRHLPASDHVSR